MRAELKKTYLLILSMLAIALIAVSCGSKDKASAQSYDFSPLDSMITSWMDKQYYPGGAIIVSKDGAIIFEKCYNDFTPQTPVYVASAGKWVAAAVIAAVVDSTDLGWDDTVESWLPEFKGNDKGKIKLRQLLSHTSGVQPYLTPPRVDTYNHLDSSVAEILLTDTVFTAGTKFEYGGLAMQIAGRMAEIAMGGKEFEPLFEDLIAEPLEMKASHFTPVNTDGGHAPMLGGGLCTTLEDYSHFLEMILGKGVYRGKRILRDATVKEMQSDQVRGAKVNHGEYVERGLGQKHNGIYGLGEWRELIDKDGTAYQISSPGWAGAYPWINLHENLYGFFIAHVKGPAARNDNYSTFYDSPKISEMVTKIVGNN